MLAATSLRGDGDLGTVARLLSEGARLGFYTKAGGAGSLQASASRWWPVRGLLTVLLFMSVPGTNVISGAFWNMMSTLHQVEMTHMASQSSMNIVLSPALPYLYNMRMVMFS